MSAGNIISIVSIAPLGLVEKVAHDAQVVPTAQHTAAQQQAVEAMRRESKLVQKTEKSSTVSKVGDEPEEERKQRNQNAHERQKEQQVSEEKPDAPNRPWAGHLLDVKI